MAEENNQSQQVQSTTPNPEGIGQVQPPAIAAPQSPVPVTGNGGADDSIIAQLQAQNAALMAQNEQLNAQVIRMINSGAQFNSHQQQAPQNVQPVQPAHVTQAQQLQAMGLQMQPENQFNPHSLSDLPDLSLEGLAAEIGKDRPKH